MATAEGLAEVIARSNEALAETLAKAFQGLKFTRAPKLKLSKFTGPPARPGDPTLGEWVEELDSYCRQLDLTREERIGVALDHLGGVAKEEILCSPPEDRDTLEKLVARLYKVFDQSESVAALTGTLYTRCQKEGETLAEFSRALMRIHDRMEQSANGPELAALQLMRDKALIERFVQGTRDDVVRRELHRIQIEKPKLSFYKFREHVLELFPECEEKPAKKHKVRETAVCSEGSKDVQVWAAAKRSDDALSQLVTSNQLIVERLEALAQQQAAATSQLTELNSIMSTKLDAAIASKRDRPTITCHYCKKTGHISKNCWKKQNRDRDGAKPKVSENLNPSP